MTHNYPRSCRFDVEGALRLLPSCAQVHIVIFNIAVEKEGSRATSRGDCEPGSLRVSAKTPASPTSPSTTSYAVPKYALLSPRSMILVCSRRGHQSGAGTASKGDVLISGEIGGDTVTS
jgi:hypothetical protein